ncbi:MAG: SNF2-related protein [Candidatus Methylomirabilia bacterium]
MITDYHAAYYAHELTRQHSSQDAEKLGRSIFNAAVDLNPHQIEAALFAFRSPLSRGAILADEVGLGKTIEAGLVISQLWAERRRRILCILPAALRPQWSGELREKFFIDSVILEGRNFKQHLGKGADNPFRQPDRIVICSYQFARAKRDEIAVVPWDLVVVDEAHRLHNVYKKSNKIARAIREAIDERPKILLTATPLQNGLMELYGLVSFIDPHVFGNEDSFRDLFAKRIGEMQPADFEALRARIRPICQRTLRRQITEYIRYTNRVPLTQDFTPTDEELRLYDAVSEYLQRPESFALPSGQRSLLTLVLRKILASSSFAIAATLGTMIRRLESKERDLGGTLDPETAVELEGDFELLPELAEEWEDDEEPESPAGESGGLSPEEERALTLKAIRRESRELKEYKALAESVTHNAKGQALLIALKAGFAKLSSLGAAPKALIFTESRRTQSYLRDLLESGGYGGEIVTLNGTNTDERSRAIYEKWLTLHSGQDCITGARSVDMRTALVADFANRAAIMIATESGAEGLNLQFCSLVVNYDLPWNPQRIEQRIGRCHRYGQQHDVVVINFLNRKNAADQRVFELLAEKLRLFSGIFGTSDEILGVLGSGVDFEKRVHEIYQTCRTAEEINSAFDRLQAELEESIRARMADTRAKLLENFDEDVHTRLRLNGQRTSDQISRFEEWLWRLSAHELGEWADFDAVSRLFILRTLPPPLPLRQRGKEGVCPDQYIGLTKTEAPLGRYRLVTHKNGLDDHQYRLGHPLAEFAIARAKEKPLPPRDVVFDYSGYDGKISVIEAERGKSGWLILGLLAVDSLEREEYLLFSATRDDGSLLEADTCAKLFNLPGSAGAKAEPSAEVLTALRGRLATEQEAIVGAIAEKNSAYFESEMEKLEAWADDLKTGLERELKELDREIRATKKEAKQATDLDAKLDHHKHARDLERRRNEKRRHLFEAQDEVDVRKETLLGAVEARLQQQVELKPLFTVRWRVV